MADDKTKTGRQDRSRVAAEQDYEVRDLAEKFDISPAQARRLIERHGNDRGTLEREARKLNR
jgi:transposase-like protein